MLRTSIEEIQKQEPLRWYGLALIFTHVLTLILWTTPLLGTFQNIKSVLQDPTPICWTFFQSCDQLRPLVSSSISPILFIYGIVVLLGAYFFATRKIRLAYAALWILTIGKWLLIIQDYRMQGNFHSMALLVSLVYLCVLGKILNIRYLLIAFYFAAALLKFNREWLSGASLENFSFFSGKFLEWAVAYVILLEMGFVLLLLSKNRWIFWFGFSQLILFHIVSWQVVGGFYPLIMLALLSAFLLAPLGSQHSPKIRWTKWTGITLGVFIVLQLPRIFFPNSDLSGEGRLASIVMFDAETICQDILIYQKNTTRFISSSPDLQVQPRFHCDPLIYLAFAKRECKENRGSFFDDLDVALFVRRKSENKFQEILNLKNVCEHPPQISWLGKVHQ